MARPIPLPSRRSQPRACATPEQLCDAFQACSTLHPVYRRLLKLTLEELRVIEDHLGQLDQQMADLVVSTNSVGVRSRRRVSVMHARKPARSTSHRHFSSIGAPVGAPLRRLMR